MDVTECKLESEKKWTDMRLKIQHIEDEVDTLRKDLNKQAKLVENIQELSNSVALLANNVKAMLEEQQKQDERITLIEQKPIKRYDSVVDKVIMLIVAALVGALLIKLGLPA